MSMTNVNTNAVVTESFTMFMVHILIDRKGVLLQVLQIEEVYKRGFDGLDACRTSACTSPQ